MMAGFTPPRSLAEFDRALSRTTSRKRNVMDSIPREHWPAIEDGTCKVDLSEWLQKATDSMPDRGGKLEIPAGLYPGTDWRADGSQGTKRDILYDGDGRASRIMKPADAGLKTAQAKRSNVMHTQGGQGFEFRDFMLEGNRSRGGKHPAYGSNWQPATGYTVDGVTYSTKANGTPVTQGDPSSVALANGGRMFVVKQAHTSGANSILADLAAGRVEEVTGQPWNDLTATGYTGYWENDADFAHRHCLYLHGEDEALTECFVFNIKAIDSVYAPIIRGSGPLFATGKGQGAELITTAFCYGVDGGGSNFGGGHNRFARDICPTSIGGHSSAFRYDTGSHDSTHFMLITQDGQNRKNGLQVYKSNRVQSIYPRMRDDVHSILILDCEDYELARPDLGAGDQVITNSTAVP